MITFYLNKAQARAFLLAYQGLNSTPVYEGEAGILNYIRHVNCIQYDPLNVAGRNAELVLQSRIAGFTPSLLEKMLYTDRSLLDGYDKVMSIYPTEDWRYFARFRANARARYASVPQIQAALPMVRETFIAKGPLTSKNLMTHESIEWSWGPARLSRAVLESMFFWGELVIHHKNNNVKVYDLASRHLPETILNSPDPYANHDGDYWNYRVLRRISGVGLLWDKAGDVWVGLAELKAKSRLRCFQNLLDNQQIVQVEVEGVKSPLYAKTQDFLRLYDEILQVQTNEPKQAFFLAPLDNLLWDRKLITELFGFEYKWEVYKPATKRNYGYYVLPVLYGDTFVARFEPARDADNDDFYIKNWWWEPDITPDHNMISAILLRFRQFLNFLGVEQAKIERSTPEFEQLIHQTIEV